MVENVRVCVTGAGGFQASWLIKLLLSKGFIVHGTVRDPSDLKNAHLMQLENAERNLQLFKAELLDYDGLYGAIEGCIGVFHVASPVIINRVPDPEAEIVEPAVKGTLNVLKASSALKVQKVIIVSSNTAVFLNPNWPKDQLMDESCWSDPEFCRNSQLWYAVAKTEAESQALEYAKTSGLKVVTVCAVFILGAMLQSNINTSSSMLISLMKDGVETLEDNILRMYVDVRDVSDALLLLFEKPEAEGRYICSAYTVPTCNLVAQLKTLYPNYNYPKKIIELEHYPEMTSEKLKKLGWKCRPFEESLVDSVKDYQQKGILPKFDI